MVRQSGAALTFACDDLRTDRQCVNEAVKQDGMALRFATTPTGGW